MPDVLTPSQQMFMLFFSILYGIMLNALIGLGAFPIAHAIAGKGIVGRGMREEYVVSESRTSLYRFLLSFFLLNVGPFAYFAIAFHCINLVGDMFSPNPFLSIATISFIGLLSLSVFAFFQFFLAFATCRTFRKYIYTPFHFRRIINEKGFHPKPEYHFLAGIAYLVIPHIAHVVVLLLSR